MVHVNANLDLNTSKIIQTGRLNESLHDLCQESLYVTFVARDKHFIDEVWSEEGETFMRVVLPYAEVLSAENIDLLVAEELYKQLDKLQWLDVEAMKKRLEVKIANMAA